MGPRRSIGRSTHVRAALTEDDRADAGALDRSVLGVSRPADHAWWVGAGTPAWAARRQGELVAYAYVDDGFIGPVLADTEDNLCALVADQLRSADDPSTMAVNLCANSESLFRMLIDAGARIDPDPPYRFVYCATDGPLPASYIHHSDWLPRGSGPDTVTQSVLRPAPRGRPCPMDPRRSIGRSTHLRAERPAGVERSAR